MVSEARPHLLAEHVFLDVGVRDEVVSARVQIQLRTQRSVLCPHVVHLPAGHGPSVTPWRLLCRALRPQLQPQAAAEFEAES